MNVTLTSIPSHQRLCRNSKTRRTVENCKHISVEKQRCHPYIRFVRHLKWDSFMFISLRRLIATQSLKGEEVKVETIAAMMQIIWITSHAAVFARWLRKE